jgi:hypothetical protein
VSGEPSLFTPGYSGSPAARRDPAPFGAAQASSGQYIAGPHGTAQYGPAGGAAGKGPIRGYPPAPGTPPPLYPPGQFSAWNRAPWPDDNGYGDGGSAGQDISAWLAADGTAPGSAGPGQAGPGEAERGYPSLGYAGAGYAEPDYSALAVSDPAADVTSTQSWGVVDDKAPAAGGWKDLSSPGGRGRHADPNASPPPGAGFAAGLAGPDQAMPRGSSEAAQRRGQPEARDEPWNRGTPRGAQAQRAGGRAGTAEAPRRQPSQGRGSRGRTHPERRSGHGRALLAVGVAVAVVAGAAGYLWLSGRHQPTAPAAATHPPAPSASAPKPKPSPSPSLGVWGHIVSRALDPMPLTLAQLFPAQFAGRGVTYTRTVQKARVHCSGALIGSALTAAVSRAGCTQVMRASYLSSGGKLMGTIGVLNLTTAAAAEKAGKAAGPFEFIAQLPAATGPTKRLTKGTGIEAAEVKGHYLVLVWAEFASLRAPKSAAQRRQLEAFISVLIQKTANVSLASREITGRPAG